ncbi:hypothetical protein [Dickeya zeae]|nr:hypothetical protein [Dickeya zeae]
MRIRHRFLPIFLSARNDIPALFSHAYPIVVNETDAQSAGLITIRSM